MGAVYRAWDEELAVAVAVKIVRPEIARTRTPRAILRSGSSASSFSPGR